MTHDGSPRLLVVYKKSQFALFEEHEPGAMADLRRREPDFHARFVTAHEENQRSIDEVNAAITARGLRADVAYRAAGEATAGYDLIVSVGGDGTLLDVSHAVLDRPLIGVNSSVFSVGHFCATDAPNFGDALDKWLAGTLAETPLTRLAITVNGVAHATPVLNEVLFAHVCPGAVSRYTITVDGHSEEHKSSGVWVGTGAGSTAALRSAGGKLQHPSDPRLQYVVREPYRWADLALVIDKDVAEGPVSLLCRMRSAALYLDGHREQVPLTLGDSVSFSPHAHPLRIVGFRHARTPSPRG